MSNYFYRLQTKFAKVMFSQVSVCPQGQGCLPHCMLPPEQNPPRSRHHLPESRHPLGADTPWSRHLPLHSACWEIRATSGRYASYWNAYFFKKKLILFYFLYVCGCQLKSSSKSFAFKDFEHKTTIFYDNLYHDICSFILNCYILKSLKGCNF